MQNVCSRVFTAFVHGFIRFKTRMVYKNKGFLTQRAVHPFKPWAVGVSRRMLWESVKGFAEAQVGTPTTCSSSTGEITVIEGDQVSQSAPAFHKSIWPGLTPCPSSVCCVMALTMNCSQDDLVTHKMNLHTTFSNLQHILSICVFWNAVFISWVSYSPPESTRGVLHRTSWVLWWIAIILLISLVPAAHQLNCWVLLIQTLASAILSKSTVALEVSPKEIDFKVRHIM